MATFTGAEPQSVARLYKQLFRYTDHLALYSTSCQLRNYIEAHVTLINIISTGSFSKMPSHAKKGDNQFITTITTI